VPDDAALRARRIRSQREFLRAVGGASDRARFVELRGSVWASLTPARPDRSVVNAVVYDDTDALLASLDELAALYQDGGIAAWTVWVPEGDERAVDALHAEGHVLDGEPRDMGGALDEMDLEPRFELDVDRAPSWTEVAEVNEAAYFASAGGAYFGPALARLDAQGYVARLDGRPASCLAIVDADDDAYVALVATRPEAQRRGLAGELLRLALRDARDRGLRTTTLEATKAGAPVYVRLGYRDLGVVEMWERRVRAAPA
jgi:ribosomal protein S18 acetylase RimI-like enzyme